MQKCICRDQQGDSRPHKKARHAPGPCACDHEDIFGLRQCTDRAFFTDSFEEVDSIVIILSIMMNIDYTILSLQIIV